MPVDTKTPFIPGPRHSSRHLTLFGISHIISGHYCLDHICRFCCTFLSEWATALGPKHTAWWLLHSPTEGSHTQTSRGGQNLSYTWPLEGSEPLTHWPLEGVRTSHTQTNRGRQNLSYTWPLEGSEPLTHWPLEGSEPLTYWPLEAVTTSHTLDH